MKKLKFKTFIILLIILTLFIISLLVIFNYQLYQRELNDVKKDLKEIETIHNNYYIVNDDVIIDGNNMKPMFINANVYVISFDSIHNITNITSYTDNGLSNAEIIKLATNFLNTNKKSDIGNLYTSRYAYYLTNKNNLIIMDNYIINNKLGDYFRMSLLIFILLEILIIYVSNTLTKWLTKPAIEAFSKQKQFIVDASHELKTPLAIITASAESLEMEPTEKKWLDNIKSESERMNKLVTDLLDLAKSENMEIKEKYNINNLSKIIEKTSLTFESLIYENKLEIEDNIDKDIMFSCNPDKIKQLLGILLDNAIKHSTKNSKITVNLYKDKNNIILEIKNKGKEITKEDQGKIFDRFYRVDESRNRSDNRYGLGLSIAKNIVTSHNGKIFVNCKNGYTTFKVIFKQV